MRTAGANQVVIGRRPADQIAALAMWILYGLVLGSNSFAVPLPERPAPSLSLVLERAGLLELTAYLIFAAATEGWARWRQASWFNTGSPCSDHR